jgi:nucleotide-binding universal stress UspA family protein
MNRTMSAPIVVGIDGSKSALTATGWAATEATRRRAPLQLRHSLSWPDGHHAPDAPIPDQSERQLRARAQGWLDEAAALARAADSSLSITSEIHSRSPVEMLVDASTAASMVVLGSRGLGGFRGLLLGSTAIGVTARAQAPVVVVRGQQHPTDSPVVVGVDSSTASDAAVQFAFAEAALRGVDLVALHTWHEDLVPYAREALLIDWDQVQRGEHDDIEQRLTPLRARYPQVTAHLRINRNQAARSLVEQSEAAQLLVVGSRGRGGVAGLLLGSTSQTLVRHAQCPVAIVRHDRVAVGTPHEDLNDASSRA